MKNREKYVNPSISEKELDALTENLLEAKFYQEKRERWNGLLEKEYDFKGDSTSSEVASRKIPRHWWLAAAVLIPLVAAVLFWPNQKSAEQMAVQFFQSEEMPSPQMRKGATDVKLWQAEANQFFSEEKFDKAILFFEKMKMEGGLSAEGYFFKGLSHFKLGQVDEAVQDFLFVQSKKNVHPKFQAETNWFLGLAYVQAGDFEKAKLEMHKVAEGSWRSAEALELLKQMEKESN